MKYIIKFGVGGVLYLVVNIIIVIWHFNLKHIITFDNFIEEFWKMMEDDGEYGGYG